jgi:hypothetical protein
MSKNYRNRAIGKLKLQCTDSLQTKSECISVLIGVFIFYLELTANWNKLTDAL